MSAMVGLKGRKNTYSTNTALSDSGVRMSLIDKSLAEYIGVEYTNREINFISISGHSIKALEAIIPEVEVEGEVLKYEAMAVAEIPRVVKEVLRGNGLDENIIIGILTLERANMIPNTATGKLERAESFIF